jgi:hypothetical protein
VTLCEPYSTVESRELEETAKPNGDIEAVGWHQMTEKRTMGDGGCHWELTNGVVENDGEQIA